jgi:Zn-dependent protease
MNGVPIARLFGFEIRIHVTWVLILATATVLAETEIESAEPSVPPLTRWAIGAVIAAAFLVSVLAHELGHAVAARARGIDVGPMTLYFFGGTASFQTEFDDPRSATIVTAAGPVVSLALAGVIGTIGVALRSVGGLVLDPLGVLLLAIAGLNVLVGGINLVPAYPLDGGRLVRAVAWLRTRDERRGSAFAALVGRAVGWLLIGSGITVMAIEDPLDGLMLAISGWFLSGASRGIERRLMVQDLLQGVRVEDVMDRGVAGVTPNLTLDTFAERLLGNEGSAVPVVRDDALVGLVGVSQVRRLRRGSWSTTRAQDVMVTPPSLPLVEARDTLWSALDRLRRAGLDALPVVEGGGLLGLVTKEGIAEAIQSRARMRGVVLR